jgi:site-specific recombinase XerD
MKKLPVNDFPRLLQAFFTDRLMKQRRVSPHTIASYRDTFRLLLKFAQRRLKKLPSCVTVDDLDASFVCAFLDYLESARGVCPRTRNVRLAAIHSFFQFLAFEKPTHSAQIQQVLAIPTKRYVRRPVSFLTEPEIDALLAAPDISTWSGRRDRTFLQVAAQTGLRVSELLGLRCNDVVLGDGAHVRCTGKGRKSRCTPLRKDSVAALRIWLRERDGDPDAPLFPSTRGSFLGRDGVEYLLRKHLPAARDRCASLKTKRVTAHSLRHSAAMEWLHHGVDRAVIALLLGHESAETTDVYLQASMKLKERAVAKTTSKTLSSRRFKPDDALLAFLKSL